MAPFFFLHSRILSNPALGAATPNLQLSQGHLRGPSRLRQEPPCSAPGPVFPVAVHRLFRGAVVGTGDCVAGGRFVESAVVSGPGRDRGGAGPLDAVADAAAGRRRDARGGVHVGAGAVGRRRLVSAKFENASRIRAFGSVRVFGHDGRKIGSSRRASRAIISPSSLAFRSCRAIRF